jgi:hypothetical protein
MFLSCSAGGERHMQSHGEKTPLVMSIAVLGKICNGNAAD